jgi:hypothetical protein
MKRIILTLQTPANYPIRILRHVLKRVWRDHQLRCIRIEETTPPNFKIIPMDKQQLERLKQFASTFRPRGGLGAIFIKLDGTSGKWKKGKDALDVTGRQYIADVPDAMHGMQMFENSKPHYCIGRIADGWKPPPPESFCEDWKPVVLLPLYDAQTLETCMFTSQSKGGRDAVVNLVDALADVYAAHPEDVDKLPVCDLGVANYINTKGKRIYVPIFETMKFVPRPEEVRRIKPPPDVLAIEHNPEPVDITPASTTTGSSTITPDLDADPGDDLPF